MKHTIVVDGSVDLDIVNIPLDGMYNITMTADEPLEYDYEVHIWRDNTKKTKLYQQPITKNERTLIWTIEDAIGLEVGFYYYEIIEVADSNRRVFKGHIEIRK